MLVAINRQYGGFSLSDTALARYKELSGNDYSYMVSRSDPYLIQVVQELGVAANDLYCTIELVSIPDDVKYRVSEHAGMEWVAEIHRTWPSYP